jgi:hypothetical protein
MNVYVEVDGREVFAPVIAEKPIEIGPDEVLTIDKMYGPLVFWDIRVRAESATCEWVVERLYGPGTDDWREVARIPGQLKSDFVEEAAP